jgi:dipeptidyl aminopeptidase/acylaminoacyl peptidase
VLGLEPGFPPPFLAPDGRSVFYTFTSPVRPPGVWLYQRDTATTTALTDAPSIGPDQLVMPTRHRVTSFDGEELSVCLYRPPAENLPVMLYLHGGPESQSMLSWPVLPQSFAAAGIAVVFPNVRGSYGYGKRFAGLMGTSYGGYMTLAGCAFQPDLWALGVDIVGMSNLVTFLERTSPYRRAFRELKYGSLEHDRDFLEKASPLNRVDDIRAPLLLVHGANDPRAPLSESQQLADSLRDRDVPVEMLVYGDEGHDLAKRANKANANPRIMTFVLDILHPHSEPRIDPQ